MANALRGLGIKKGDRVAIYMPMIPELPIAMLACARIGAPHSVVFGGFSADALAGRIDDAECVAVITADGGYRKGATVPLKANADEAIGRTSSVQHCVVVKRTGDDVAWTEGRDLWWHDLVEGQPTMADPEPMDSEDLLYLLYTSGTTAKPKGIMHTTGGYLVGTSTTHRYIFDIKPEDVYWCMADIGWVTGPLLHRVWPAGQRDHRDHLRGRHRPSPTRTDGPRSRPSTAPRSCTPPQPPSGR